MSEIEIDAESSPLWHLLAANELVEEDVLLEVYQAHLDTGKPMARLLVSSGVIDEQELLRLTADFLSSKIVDLKAFSASEEILALIPDSIARMYSVIPYELNGDALGIVAADPLNYNIVEDISYRLDMPVYMLVAKPENVRIAVDHYYPDVNESVVELLSELETLEGGGDEDV